MSTSMIPELGSLSFWRIVDAPFETCVATLDGWLRTRDGGELRLGGSQLLGPMEHDRDLGTRRIQVRLARGTLHPLLRMRLDIDRWSSSSTALELIPCRLVRPTADYFRAGRLLLDSLTCSLTQRSEPWVTAGFHRRQLHRARREACAGLGAGTGGKLAVQPPRRAANSACPF